MKTAKWIWYPGDFEIYHHLLLSCRRQEFGCDYPCAWRVASPEKNISFYKKFTAEADTVIKVVTHSKGMIRLDDVFHKVNEKVCVEKGEHIIEIQLFDIEAFPSVFINSEYLVTDETWTCEARDTRWFNAECEPAYLNETDDPKIFPFLYKKIEPVSIKNINDGLLYDFGKETFGPVTINNKSNPEGINLFYGESEKEALDEKWAIIREELTDKDSLIRPARAFRYIFAKSKDKTDIDISAEYEYLPLNDLAYFECDNPEIQKIWNTCSYTFHLNSREFFLDGIKRDRWVWSGDAYQSFKINRCLFNDNAITERTITALLGKPPYNMHINRINDYSAYLIISVYEHYYATGRIDFVKKIWENLKELFYFIEKRLDENGLSCERYGDWIFIDWGVLDKDGPHCVEQILLWKVYEAITKLSEAVGDNINLKEKSEKLYKLINEKYWNNDKGAFIDSFTSGKDFVTKQTNVMAVLFDFATKNQTELIIKNVFKNDNLPNITTPYFKLYELLALCKCNMIEETQNYILSYWGDMIKLGATSIWEFYDNNETGDQHYAMYGTPFAKSLCHAWGSGPILLLIKYCVGLSATSDGFNTFSVEPNPGIFKSFKAKAPVRDGYIEIEYIDNKINIKSTVSGGTLIWNGQKTKINKEEE